MKFAILSIMIALLVPKPITVEAIPEPPLPQDVVQEVSATTTSEVIQMPEEDTKEEEVIEKPVKGERGKYACSCVQTARYVHKVNIPMNHNASDMVPNSEVAVEGQLIIMKYPNSWHVAVVKEVREDGYLIAEGNYHRCKEGERVIPKDYYAIVGFWTEYN